jgi:nucleoside-diphosphate-sugar epimerase
MFIRAAGQRSVDAFHGLKKESPVSAVILGAGGRLGKEISAKMNDLGFDVLSSSRVISTASEGEIRASFKGKNIGLVINAAVESSGTLAGMRNVNVDMPLRVASAAKKQGNIPFIHISTTATQVEGLGEHTPYATTKLESEEALKGFDNVKIARLDALTGDSSHKIHIGHMAGGGLPVSVFLKGGERFFQPTSYKAASTALANMSLACLSEEGMKSLPSVMNFAGDPIAVNDFVRMLNQTALEFHIAPEDLLEIARVVQNGALTPEFLHLANSSSDNYKIHCNEAFRMLLGSEGLPTHADLVQEMNEITCPIQTVKGGYSIYQGVEDKLELLSVVAKFAKLQFLRKLQNLT